MAERSNARERREQSRPGAAVPPAAPRSPPPRGPPLPAPAETSHRRLPESGPGTPALRPRSRRLGQRCSRSLPPPAAGAAPGAHVEPVPASPDPPCPRRSPEGGPLPRSAAVRGRRAAAPFVEELLEQGGSHAAVLPLPPPRRQRPHRASCSGSAGGERRRRRQHPRRRGAAQHCAEGRRRETRGAKRSADPLSRAALGGRPSPDRGAEPARPAALTAAPTRRTGHRTARRAAPPAAAPRERGRERAAALERSALATRRSLPRPQAQRDTGLPRSGRWRLGTLAGGGAERGVCLRVRLRSPVGLHVPAAAAAYGCVCAQVLHLCYTSTVISTYTYICNG